MNKLESSYQRSVIKKLKTLFPDCVVLKLDAGYIQGLPDLLVLSGNKWAALECKRSEKAKKRPNQEFYVNKFNGMSFASFIYPENEEVVFDGLQRTLRLKR